jgi:hypothetical protein
MHGEFNPVRDEMHETANLVLRKMRSRNQAKLNGLGVREIPIFQYPLREIPRLDKDAGFRRINHIIYPASIRS